MRENREKGKNKIKVIKKWKIDFFYKILNLKYLSFIII